MKKRYYIVIFDRAEPSRDLIQSKWFKSKKSALKWLEQEFDFHDVCLGASLLSAMFDDEENYDDVELEETLCW